VRLPRPGPQAFLRLAQASVVLVVLNVVSGAAVRLTDSGLGCPDWPTCSARSLTPPLSLHPAIEFANRMVVVALTVAAVATALAALRRRPRRPVLLWLSAALVAGVVGEAVLGGIVVYTKLNPYAVMVHFMVGVALLTAALVLALRAGEGTGPASGLGTGVRRLSTGLAVVVLLAVCAGTATTGTGPHAGGRHAVRLPVPLDDMARTHSGLVLAAGVLLLALLAVLYRERAPQRVQERAQLLMAAMVAQGVIGYVQFFLHLPALLVGVHVFGATLVWSATVWLLDAVRRRAPATAVIEPLPAPAPLGTDAAVVASR
jgi:cytochrome c oxidase assembly protein subunit 15